MVVICYVVCVLICVGDCQMFGAGVGVFGFGLRIRFTRCNLVWFGLW